MQYSARHSEMISKNFNNELFLNKLVLVSDFNSISLYVTAI